MVVNLHFQSALNSFEALFIKADPIIDDLSQKVTPETLRLRLKLCLFFFCDLRKLWLMIS